MTKTRAQTFAQVLKTYRTTEHLSQARLAELADVDHSMISRLEAGTRMPSRDLIHRLADSLTLGYHKRLHLLRSAGFDPMHGVYIPYEAELLLDDLREKLSRPDMPPIIRSAAYDGLRSLSRLVEAGYSTVGSHKRGYFK